jgi:hypothetical protein
MLSKRLNISVALQIVLQAERVPYRVEADRKEPVTVR